MDELIERIIDWLERDWGIVGLLGTLLAVGLVTLVHRSYFVALRDGGVQRDDLRFALSIGGDPRGIYVAWMKGALDQVDRVVGDAALVRSGRAHPDWNGQLFEVCVLFALVYPSASVALTWIAVGDAGTVGAAVGLKSDPGVLARLALTCALASFVAGIFLRAAGRRTLVVAALALAIGLAVAVAGAGTMAVAGAVASAIVGATAVRIGNKLGRATSVGFDGLLILTTALVVIGTLAVADAAAAAIALLLAAIISGIGAFWAALAKAGRKLGMFWALFFPPSVLAFAIVPNILASRGAPDLLLAAFPFVMLIALVNVPFDWLSIGLTRRLLRWGLEERAPHPFLIAILDFALAVIMLTALGIATIVALEAVNVGSEIGGASPPYPLPAILTDLRTNPASPSHAWIYFTLFSTLIPSLLNLTVAIVSLVAWPIPAKALVGLVDRYSADPTGRSATLTWLPVLLTGVWVVGVALSILAFYVAGRAFLFAPGVGAAVLDAASAVSECVSPLVETVGRWLDYIIPG